ncbi:MAG: hypothetical protein IIC71_11575, partial [Acidobacteria bacterium]|nr:hypothetical protein [Acidobacteriota bacterium]
MTLQKLQRRTVTTQPVGGTRFASLLMFAILGYMFFDRAFAWIIHVPGIPVFLGEVVLVLGVVELVRGRPAFRFLVARTATAKWVAAFLIMGFLRLAADFGTYGIDAIRDSAIFYYSALALIVATYVMVRPEEIQRAMLRYGRAIPWFVVWAPIAVFVGRTFVAQAPLIPGSLTSVVSFKGGNYAVWLSLAVAYLWLVEKPSTAQAARRRSYLTAAAIGGIFVAGTQNRGGFLVG